MSPTMSTRFSESMWMREDSVKRPSVRRCLFGRPDQQNVNEALSLQEETQERCDADAKRFRDRWGLDPKSGVPVDGAEYECTPVNLRTEPVPEFYTKGYAPRKSKPAGRIRESWRGPQCQFLFAGAQQNSRRSVKRRLQLDQGNDDQENNPKSRLTMSSTCTPAISQLRVPSPLHRDEGRDTDTSSLTVSTSPFMHFKDSPAVQQHSVTIRPSIFSSSSRRILPPPHFLDLATPRSIEAYQQTPKHQTLMKDFFPLQKMRRSSSSKSLLGV